METVQGNVKVQEGMKIVGAQLSTIYLMMAHPRCGTRRVFKVGEFWRQMVEGQQDGHFITTYCHECNETFSVEIFVGVDVPSNYSYLPNQLAAGDEIADPAGMSKQESNPFGNPL